MLKEFKPRRLVPTLTAALVSGTLGVMISISFVALIFDGELERFVAVGIGMVLFSTIALRLVTALLSSFPGIIADVDAFPAAVLAVIAASIYQGLPAGVPAAEKFTTIAVAIALTSVLTGLFLLVLGHCKAGEWIRCMPYPVIGGFLAGTGWLLVKGALQLMADVPLNMAGLPLLLAPATLVRWLPALGLALVLLAATRCCEHCLVLPVGMAAAMALFFGLLPATGTSLAEAGAKGWLLGPFPADSLWQPISITALAQVNWPAILAQTARVTAIMVLSAPSILLAACGLELVSRRHIDVNRELIAAGLANIASGLGGGMVGYHTVSDTTLAFRMGARSRLVGLGTAALGVVVLVHGGAFLSFFPKPVLGALLLFVGLSFLLEWLYEGWFRLSKIDFGLVVAIVVLIDILGFLAAIAIGLVLAALVFVFEYSRHGAVQYTATSTGCPQAAAGMPEPQPLPSLPDGQIYLLGLQDFIFFATAYGLFRRIRERLHDPRRPPLRCVVFDFQCVRGMDSSAVMNFAKIKRLAERHGLTLVFVGLQPAMQRKLAKGMDFQAEHKRCIVFEDLPSGLRWCQTRALAHYPQANHGRRP